MSEIDGTIKQGRLLPSAEQPAEAIVITDVHGTIGYVNAAFTAMTGYTCEDALGTNAARFQSGQRPQSLHDAMWKTIRSGEVWQKVVRSRRKNGEIYTEHEQIAPIKSPQGEITGFIQTKREIKRPQAIDEPGRNLETILDARERMLLAARAGGVGIWDYDVMQNEMIWDEQMYRLYGCVEEEPHSVWETWLKKLHPEDLRRMTDEISAALTGKKDFDTEFRVVWPDGSIRHIRAFAVTKKGDDGFPIRMIGTNWDITAQKEAADELLESNRHLAEETLRAAKLAEDAAKANAKERIPGQHEP